MCLLFVLELVNIGMAAVFCEMSFHQNYGMIEILYIMVPKDRILQNYPNLPLKEFNKDEIA